MEGCLEWWGSIMEYPGGAKVPGTGGVDSVDFANSL